MKYVKLQKRINQSKEIKAKYNFYNKEKVKISNMIIASPRKFLKYIKKFRNSNS